MWRDSLPRRATAIVLGVCFFFQISGCTSWSAQPTQVLAQKSYDVVRVIQNDGSRAEVFEPRVADDSLSGFAGGPSTSHQAKAVRIALADIRYLEIRKGDAGKTVLLVAGIGITLLLVAAIAAATSDISFGNGGGGDTTGSCPFIYSWDGHQWRLDSGTFGGAVMPALQRTDLDNLAYATPSRGILRLKLANELRETDYVDAFSILAVDHPPGVSVLPDAGGQAVLHAVGRPDVPRAARDAAGRDQLTRVGVSDGIFWESDLRPRDPAIPGDVSDRLELAFRRPAGAAAGTLVLDVQNTPWAAHLMVHLVRGWGRDVTRWYDPTTAAAVAQQLGPALADVGSLSVQVKVDGRWETRGRVWEIGPEMTKRVAMPLDLTGVTGDQVEIRLQSTPNFWLLDYAGLDFTAPAPFAVRELALERALDTRGIDVRSQLAAEDGTYYTMTQGDAAELTVKVPPVPSGMVRSYLARTVGWYRIEGAESAPPDVVLLEAMNAPGGPTRIALELSNQALNWLR
jgi:hypothetical protein